MGLCNSVMKMICGESDEQSRLPDTVANSRNELETKLDKMRRERRERLEAECAQSKVDAERELAEMQKADEGHIEEIRSGWKPEVRITDYPIGTFIGYGTEEHPARYIEGIEIEHPGREPFIDQFARPDFDSGMVFTRYTAASWIGQVKITMTSGAKHMIRENRHKLPFVHEALVHAWKNAKS